MSHPVEKFNHSLAAQKEAADYCRKWRAKHQQKQPAEATWDTDNPSGCLKCETFTPEDAASTGSTASSPKRGGNTAGGVGRGGSEDAGSRPLATRTAEESHPSIPPSVSHPLIRECLPNRKRRLLKALFELARRLKVLPGLGSGDEAALSPWVRAWWKGAGKAAKRRWREFYEVMEEFMGSWEKVRAPAGEGILDESLAVAHTCPLVRPSFYGSLTLGVLASWCRELQRRAPAGKTFYLGVRSVEARLHLGRMTAWRALQKLQRDGLLRKVKNGTKASGEASEWLYLG